MIVEEVGASGKYENYDKRVIIWPVRARVSTNAARKNQASLTRAARRVRVQVYIDAKKTIADGRKIPVSQCVEYPMMQELKEVIEHLGYEAAYEEKAYPRDLTQFGRFRVLLKDPATGEPKVDGIATRRQLLIKIGELIPNLKSRKEGKVAKPGMLGIALPGYAETLMPVAQAQAPPMHAGAGGSGGSSKKKKGKDKADKHAQQGMPQMPVQLQ